MTRRPPHAEGDGPTQLIVAAFWLFVAIVWIVAAGSLAVTAADHVGRWLG
jgi:hypothetical protein